jgi:hypothetical protein
MSEPLNSGEIFFWVFFVSLLILGVFLISLLTSCSTADPPIVKDGCAVNLKKVCQYVVDSGEVVSTQDGMRLDRQRMQNISVRHVEVLVPFRRGSGTLLRCVIDTQTARVTDAGIASGPQFNDTDIQHLRQNNLCQ